MRYLSILILVFFPSVAVADQFFTPRPVDALAAEVLARAIERSATVRRLVKRLEGSNVIVHVESSRSMPLGLSGMTRFVVSRGGVRYLRITIGSDLPGRARTAILAHELQHACEVADSDADDEAGLRAMFEHHGHRSGDYFETSAAITAERAVLLELRTSRTLQAEPVAKFDH